MQNLTQIQLQSTADRVKLEVILRRYLSKFKMMKSEIDYYSMQTVITFEHNFSIYQLVLPIGTTDKQIEFYLKEQLPELLL